MKEEEVMKEEEIRKVVREGYARIAKQGSSCCTPVSSCCGSTDLAGNISRNIGYTEEELKAVPEGANLGLGCGNPVALASLQEGDTVLDLGSGAGFDCFLAASRVGEKGRVIGVDMTPEMIEKARENARKGDYGNVEFGSGRLRIYPRLIILLTSSSRTVSSIYRLTRGGSLRKRSGC
jgi:arsenite methyltransferase